LNIDVWEILIPIIDKHLTDVEQLNRQQLKQGKRADGTDTPSHGKSGLTERYIDSKIQRGVYDRSIYPSVNLYNTGAFQKGIVAKLDIMAGIEVDSTDFKANALEERYGSTIYGLNNLSLEKFIDLIIEEFKESLLNHILKD
jgi:hypothetical protein